MKNGDCQRICQVLLDSLDDEPRVRITAIEMLVRMGIQDKKIEDAMKRTAQERYGSDLLYAMKRVGYTSPLVISIARDLLLNGHSSERRAAIRFVEELKDRGSVPLLIQVAQEQNPQDENLEGLIQAIGNIGEADLDAIRFLCLVIQVEDFNIKLAAAVALARLGFDVEAIPFLQNLMNTDNAAQRIRVACRLVDLGKQNLAYPVLLDVMENYSRYFYLPEINEAVWYSRYLQSYKDRVVPLLRKIVQEGRFFSTRRAAFDSLASIGANDQETISFCRGALRDRHLVIRIKALRSLICLGEATPKDVNCLNLQERYEWEDLSRELRTVDREKFSGEVVKAIAALLGHRFVACVDTQRLLFHLGIVHEGNLDRLVSRLPQSPVWLRENILCALSDMWFAMGCQSSSNGCVGG